MFEIDLAWNYPFGCCVDLDNQNGDRTVPGLRSDYCQLIYISTPWWRKPATRAAMLTKSST